MEKLKHNKTYSMINGDVIKYVQSFNGCKGCYFLDIFQTYINCAKNNIFPCTDWNKEGYNFYIFKKIN